VSPSNDDRRMREAARTLNTFITGAQTRAIALNRPYGIALKRLSQDTKRTEDNGVCLEVFYVEQQPPYAGFDANSRCCVSLRSNGLAVIRFITRGNQVPQTTDRLPAGWDPDLFPDQTIGPGDVIEVGGTRFQLQEGDQTVNLNTGQRKPSAQGGKYYFPPSPNAVPTALAWPINDTGQQINPRYDDAGYSIGPDREPSPPAPAKPPSPYWTSPAPYKIFRQPTPATEEPYQLPEGTAIDLRASGVGVGDYFYWPNLNDNSEGVIIMFAPEGRVSRVSYSQLPINSTSSPESATFDQAVVDNVYLLLGRRENIPAPDANKDLTLTSSTFGTPKTDEEIRKLREPDNWLRGTSLWVVIGSQSGRIATIDNGYVDLQGVLNNPQAPFNTAAQGTEQMRAAQILAAREFTHEMSQKAGR
jgi:hypothetical protein